MSFFKELQRRNVVRVGIAYAVIGWVIAQIAEFAFENFGAPDWVLKTIIVILLLGLPLALFFAWAYEVTPEGIKREKDVDRSQSITAHTGRKLDFIIIGALAVALLAVVWDSYIRNTSDAQPDVAAPSVEASIAVLPFVNMSNDPDQEYFADGITEEILNTLVAIEGLQVAGRTSSFTFKERTDVDLRTIGEMLGVANVLEGSVRKSGNKLRITAQLIKVDDGFHLWSKIYDRQVADIFDIQEEIANAIGGAMQLELGIGVSQSIDARRLENEEAYEAWLRGWSQIRSSDYAVALETFAELNEMEPEYLPGYRAKVQAYSILLGTGLIDEATYQEEVPEILRIVTELDSNAGERYIIAAWILMDQADWQGAVDALDKAVHLGIDAEMLFTAKYNAAQIDGREDDALALLHDTLVSDPLKHDRRAEYALGLMRKGRLKEAEAEVAKLMQMAPHHAATLNANFSFHAYFNDEIPEAIKWATKRYQYAESVENQSYLMMRLLLDLGNDSAAEELIKTDPAYDDYPYTKPPVEYHLARYRGEETRSLTWARTIGEHLLAMGQINWYLEDLDWLRLLQRADPEFGLRIYEKRATQLTTKTPIVVAYDTTLAISLADLYLRTGKIELANNLLDQCLEILDSSSDHYTRPATTMLYALKGDTENALRSLRNDIDANWRWDWWLLEKDPAYEILWDEPEFQAMMDEIRRDMKRQRRELDARIESGEIDLTLRRNSD